MEMNNPKVWQQRLRAAKKLFQLGCVQSDIKATFGDAVGQKLYMLCVLNTRFPELKILDFDEKTLAKIKGSYLPGLVQRSDPKALEEFNRREVTAGRCELRATTAVDLAGLFQVEKPASKQETRLISLEENLRDHIKEALFILIDVEKDMAIRVNQAVVLLQLGRELT